MTSRNIAIFVKYIYFKKGQSLFTRILGIAAKTKKNWPTHHTVIMAQIFL